MQIEVRQSGVASGSPDYDWKRNASEFAQGSPGSFDSKDLERFYELQVEQVAKQAAIAWVQVVYYNPSSQTHQEVVSQPQMDLLSRSAIAYLKSAEWLSDFPPVLTLVELALNQINTPVYFCPMGYRNCQPEYLIVVAQERLSPALQESLVQAAARLSQYLALYSSYCYQHAEIQLLEQVVHRVGHQLRNPLGLIALSAENLRLGLPVGALWEQATIISETVQALLSNLSDLIYCGKGSHLRVTLQDLRQLVIESLQGLQPWLQQKQIQVVYPDTPVLLMIDRLQLKQVFDNLLSNAINFSPDASSIHIHWSVFQSEVLIQIMDQGPGLSDDDLEKVFNPFYSCRPGGTGLGLTIAKKIVLDHQGSIWAQNLLEGGARFSIILPRSKGSGGSHDWHSTAPCIAC